MSNKEKAIELINQIPESKLYYVISFLQGAAIPDEIPNVITIAAMNEINEMIASGTGQHFANVDDLFASLEE